MKPAGYICAHCRRDRLCHHMSQEAAYTRADLVRAALEALAVAETDAYDDRDVGIDASAERIVANMLAEVES